MTPKTSTEPQRTACFYVHAAAEPGVMPRVLGQFAKRGLIPAAWHSTIGGTEGDELHIDIQVAGMAVEQSEYVARCLRQLAYVETVLTSQKGYARTA